MSLEIPVFLVEGENLPQAWEKAVLTTWEKGFSIKTEYDKQSDPPSRDCTMIMIVKNPLAEPRIHRAFPAGLKELEVYRQEVVEGIHDDWINPAEGKWTYTYHQRLFSYPVEGKKVNQIEYLVNKLAAASFTRRAQAITWHPLLDPPTEDPPCLQRVWFRLTKNESGSFSLNMNTHWRSRDAYKAAFMNIFALTDLQKVIAKKVEEKIEKEVKVGRYVDISDSFHIYGSYFPEFENFLKIVKTRTFEERTWTTDFAKDFFV